jgi:maleylacetate reductase
MKLFNFTSLPSRVIFGDGSLVQVKQEIELLGAKRALVLCTPEQRVLAQQVLDLLGNSAAGIFDRAVMHVPIETAQEARKVASELGADCAVAVGGGSTTGVTPSNFGHTHYLCRL